MAEKSSTKQKVYDFVCENPGLCTYVISKRMGMSGGRVRYALTQLQKMGLIKFKFDRSNPRIKKLSYPVDAWHLLPGSLKKLLKKIRKRL